MADHDDLDRLVRASLERRAGEADTTAPVAHRAKGAVSRRRTTRIAVGAAAAVIVAITVTGLLVQGDDSTQPPADRGDDSLPSEWRTEYWRDMRVDVPADWGWGGAPPACGVGPVLDADGHRVGPDIPYVGRPISTTDVCGGIQNPPTSSYVWLGSNVRPGVVDLGGGFVAETVEVNGSNLTVASDSAALREHILDTAAGGESCLSDTGVTDALPQPDPEAGKANDLLICVYQRTDFNHPTAELSYAIRRDATTLRRYAEVLPDERPRDQCPEVVGDEDYEWVVVVLEDANGRLVRQDVVHFSCPSIDVGATSLGGDLETVPRTHALDRMVLAGAMPAILYTLIGPQG